MRSKEDAFKEISEKVMRCFHEELHAYLSEEPGTLTDADVTVLIMNLNIAIATNTYYSLKQILPTTPLDFDFMKAKLINALVDSYEKIKIYSPKDRNVPLTVEQIQEIKEKGFTMVKMTDGTERKITEKDILLKKEDAEKVLKGGHLSPKIIAPNNGKIILNGVQR